MYHIKENKRIKESARLISEALFYCLERKPFNEITITDVQKKSTVGRATFYRIFDSLTDVLSYQCNLMFERILPNIESIPKTDVQMENFLHELMQNEKLLEIIVNSNHLEVLYDAQQKRTSILMDSINLNSHDNTYVEYTLGIMSSIMIGVLTTWIKREKKESADDLCKIGKDIFDACLKPFIQKV